MPEDAPVSWPRSTRIAISITFSGLGLGIAALAASTVGLSSFHGDWSAPLVLTTRRAGVLGTIPVAWHYLVPALSAMALGFAAALGGLIAWVLTSASVPLTPRSRAVGRAAVPSAEPPGPAGWQPRASTVWSADLVKVRSRLGVAARYLVPVAFGGGAAPWGAEDIVVTDRLSGEEVIRGHAGDSAEAMLADVRRDLAKMTAPRFRAKWDQPADRWLSIWLGSA